MIKSLCTILPILRLGWVWNVENITQNWFWLGWELFWMMQNTLWFGMPKGFLRFTTVLWKRKSLSPVQLRHPLNCSPPGPSVNGIFQARILEWVAIFSGDLPDWGIEPQSPAWQADSSPFEPAEILSIKSKHFYRSLLRQDRISKTKLSGVIGDETMPLAVLIVIRLTFSWYKGLIWDDCLKISIEIHVFNLITIYRPYRNTFNVDEKYIHKF